MDQSNSWNLQLELFKVVFLSTNSLWDCKSISIPAAILFNMNWNCEVKSSDMNWHIINYHIVRLVGCLSSNQSITWQITWTYSCCFTWGSSHKKANISDTCGKQALLTVSKPYIYIYIYFVYRTLTVSKSHFLLTAYGKR